VKWRRSPNVLWRAAPGYLALATVDGRCIEVGGSGDEVWTRLAAWLDEQQLVADLARLYGVEERRVSPDVRSLLQDLHAQGYVERND